MNNETRDNHFLMQAWDCYLQNSPDMIFVKDIKLRYRGASMAFVNMAGCKSADEIIGKTDFEIFSSDLANRYINDDSKVIKSGESIINNVEPIPDQEGKSSYSSTSKYIIRDKNGDIIGLYGTGRDVTAQIELEEEIERRELSREMFEDILEGDLTKNKMIRLDVSSWAKEMGLKRDCLFSEAVEFCASMMIHPDYSDEFRALYDLEKLMFDYNNGETEFSHMTYKKVDEKTYKWIECSTRLYLSKISQTIKITTFFKDLDEETRSKQQLTIKAQTDELTGVLNRKSVIEKITEIISDDESYTNHALLFIDLDYFKQVNDQLGHLFGDKILVETAKKLKTVFRESDIIGRVGGDEFLVLVKNISSPENIEIKAKKIFEMLSFHINQNGRQIYVTCSIGVSMYKKGDGKKFEQLYEEADQAMYKAKKNGRNRISFYGN